MLLFLSLCLLYASAAAVPPQRVHLVVNPFGGGGAGLAALDTVLPIFETAGIQANVLKTKYAGHAGDYARSVDLLDGFIGIGGDGTAHEIANGMLSRADDDRVPVGIIPAGSGNTWGFDLGLDDAVGAAQVISRGATRAVDVMSIELMDDNGGKETKSIKEFAINICGYGMPSAVLEQANALRVLGSAQYKLAGLILIATGRTSFGATITIERDDGTQSTTDIADLSFAQGQINMHMGKRVCFAPGAEMDDGLLDLVLIKRSGGADILRANAQARGATHVDLPFVEIVRCKSYTVTPRRAPTGYESALNLDGELVADASFKAFKATCVPRALDVFAAKLNKTPMDTSVELEPQLVLGLLDLFEKSILAKLLSARAAELSPQWHSSLRDFARRSRRMNHLHARSLSTNGASRAA